MSEAKLGRVKWFNNRKGFGFLTDCDSNEDVFIHFSAVQTPEDVYKSLIEGEYVQYELGTDNKGKTVANNVTGVRGGPLLCQNTERRVYSVRLDSEEGSERQQRQRTRRTNRSTRYQRRKESESNEQASEQAQVQQSE